MKALILVSASVSATYLDGSHVSSSPFHFTRNSSPPPSGFLWLLISLTSHSSPSESSTARVRGVSRSRRRPREGLGLSLASYLALIAGAERPGSCLAIASQDSPCSFSWQIFASSYNVYLALCKVGLGFAVVLWLLAALVLLRTRRPSYSRHGSK